MTRARNTRRGKWPYAVVQLRQDNKLGTLWNMVGFQTKLKYGAQVELFRTIPGLENAEFARLGGLHRNTFLNSPRVLDRQLRLRAAPHVRFAGQVTGCEGYVESAAIGLVAGMMTACELAGSGMATPASINRPGRAAEPYYRRRRCRDVPAHERQFRAVPTASRGEEEAAQGSLHLAGQSRSQTMDHARTKRLCPA